MIDVAVIGGGTMGSSAAYHCAIRGKRVAVFEQFDPVHNFGSHGGITRIIRHAYFESPDYVPLILRSDEMWQQLESRSGMQMLVRTGGLDMGPETGILFAGAIQACITHKLPYEHLRAVEAMKRWPHFRVPSDWEVCFDPMAGFLIVDRCIRAYLEGAIRHGAELLTRTPVLRIDLESQPIRIETPDRMYQAENAIICGGAWNLKLLSDLKLPLHIQRQPLGWFRLQQTDPFEPERFPVFLAETPQGMFYGFPLYHLPGIKIARHGGGRKGFDADAVDRSFNNEDAGELRNFLLRYINDVTDEVLDGKICLYTMTADEHFILDLHPANSRIAIAAGFSGHGFKFAPVVGEVLADLCLDGKTSHAITTFRISRFHETSPP